MSQFLWNTQFIASYNGNQNLKFSICYQLCEMCKLCKNTFSWDLFLKLGDSIITDSITLPTLFGQDVNNQSSQLAFSFVLFLCDAEQSQHNIQSDKFGLH